MRINLSQLKKLNVETKSGRLLGKVYDIVFETEGQTVAQYFVKPRMVSMTMTMNMNLEKYLISRNQVISIDAEKIVVNDNIEKITDEVSEGEVMPGANPVLMRESE